MSDEDVELINQLNPKMLEITLNIYAAKNIKALSLLNCADIKAYFYEYNKDRLNQYNGDRYSTFLLANTPLQLFDSESNQMNTFE